MTTRLAAVTATALLVLGAAACSPSSAGDDASQQQSSGGKTTVTVRIWDEQVAKAYEQSFAAFTKANPDITVKLNLVPFADYFTKLPLDVSSGTVEDIFWTNTTPFGALADSGALIDVGSALADEKSGWVPAAVEQYTRGGKLWGVPALTDGRIALFYNADLVKQAGVNPATLRWDPSEGSSDTFLPAARKLTKDSAGHSGDQAGFDGSKVTRYAYNAGNDLQAIYWNFVGSNGGAMQADGGTFVFADAKGEQAFQYLVDLINKYHVAPSAADTNDNGDFSRDKFLQGKMALFQSGTYNLKNVADGAKFDWAIAPLPEGPAGRVSVVNSVIAAGNAKTPRKDATLKVLKWLGSTEGASFVGASGAALPAVTGAQQAYFDFWKKQGVDTSPFGEAGGTKTIAPPFGPKFGDGANAYAPIFKEIFAGRTPVGPGLEKAQDAANEAIK